MKNTDLKKKYDDMHTEGTTAWFDDGTLERQLIFKMGEPWHGKNVLEIGCGEGDLLAMIEDNGARVTGIDYSARAVSNGEVKHPGLKLLCADYKDFAGKFDVIVMQGVLEHQDSPLVALKWMIDAYQPSVVITSSPAFINPRGIVWMVLDMLGAVMSKTDIHYLNPWQFEAFCFGNGYRYQAWSTDTDWAKGKKMVEDLAQRIPLALVDGHIKYKKSRLDKLLKWLEQAGPDLAIGPLGGAVVVYRIDI